MSKPSQRFHVECNPDERLLQVLGVDENDIRHWRDKGRVFKHVFKTNGVVGLVDEDPSASLPTWLRPYRPEEYAEWGLKVYRWEHSRLVVLCPRLEDWILCAAKEVEVDPATFHLPSTGEKLHEVVSTENKQRLDEFSEFVQEIRNRNSCRLQQLRDLLAI